ncbi:MAG: phosphonate degradation associated HDIG domain protein [Planctomycetota bacterium]|jgi:phosphonate degradation associated HDIG domain protein
MNNTNPNSGPNVDPNVDLDFDKIIDVIFDLFKRRGAEEYLGEAVSIADHMEQSAACAVADNAADHLVIAALLHDIGHLVCDFPSDAMDNGIDTVHEQAGADFLQPFFPASVVEPIRLHVAAKRYLCAVDDEYLGNLSRASVQSLQLQGGPMSEAEVIEFEQFPFYLEAARTRRYDDDGKVNGLTIKPVTDYRQQLQAMLNHSKA